MEIQWKTRGLNLPALASVPKGDFPDFVGVAVLHISNNNGNKILKNSGFPKAFITWKTCESRELAQNETAKVGLQIKFFSAFSALHAIQFIMIGQRILK